MHGGAAACVTKDIMMTENEIYRMHAYVRGRVQGVGFRYHTLQTAQELELTGWVRNLRDGRVEVLAEGAHEDLNRLLVALRKGPISADVQDVDYEFTEAKGEFEGFRVRYTG
jgi:acylphosphatase